MKLLEGKVAVITGAARGIGKAIALKFASEGADIAFTDLVIDENGKATEKEIAAFGVRAKGYASNAANFEEAHKVVEEIVKDFGRIDVLVNNAGITRDGLMMRMTEQQWDMVLTVNLKSAFNFIHAVTPIMMKQKCGSIINMTVYSYGRYNGTNKGPDRSSNSLGNGSGVLLKLMGDEAKAYNDKKAAGGMSVFVVTDVADEKVANILDEKFNMSTTMPDNPKSDYYNSSSARIIDEYKLTSNNCTTMVSDVLNKSGSNALKETRLQQTSNFGTWTTIPIVNRFILPISMQNHLVRISKPGGVVYKTR